MGRAPGVPLHEYRPIAEVESSASGVELAQLINRDCYGAGWLVRLRPDDWPSARHDFLPAAALPLFAEQMRLDGFDPQAAGGRCSGSREPGKSRPWATAAPVGSKL